MEIRIDDLSHPAIHALLEEHLAHMHALSPPECVYALDLAGLRDPAVTFWSAWDGATLLGCAALRELDARHAEIKSMRSASAQRRRGVGKALLHHLIDQAGRRGYTRLSLETGPQPGFLPARSLYEKAGFKPCGPFGDYRDEATSVFMTRAIEAAGAGAATASP